MSDGPFKRTEDSPKSFSIIFAHENAENYDLPSIFLAGPSPRNDIDYDWRPEAIEHLERTQFYGNVFSPLPREGEWLDDYEGQIDWEVEHLNSASVIVFWIPRDKDSLPGFTTNVEYGEFLKSGKIVLGFPKGADKMGYLEYRAKKEGVPVFHTLEDTIQGGIELEKKLNKN